MKKNNKFRNNNNYNNQVFSLNYRFDSISSAGKVSGTALDLIKKYNELAKEAHGNGDYVEAEVFRQYAEHYRKIVTEINERKAQMQPRPSREENDAAANNTTPVADVAAPAVVENTPVEAAAPVKREFKVIEISSSETNATNGTETVAKSKVGRPRGRRKSTEEAAV